MKFIGLCWRDIKTNLDDFFQVFTARYSLFLSKDRRYNVPVESQHVCHSVKVGVETDESKHKPHGLLVEPVNVVDEYEDSAIELAELLVCTLLDYDE